MPEQREEEPLAREQSASCRRASRARARACRNRLRRAAPPLAPEHARTAGTSRRCRRRRTRSRLSLACPLAHHVDGVDRRCPIVAPPPAPAVAVGRCPACSCGSHASTAASLLRRQRAGVFLELARCRPCISRSGAAVIVDFLQQPADHLRRDRIRDVRQQLRSRGASGRRGRTAGAVAEALRQDDGDGHVAVRAPAVSAAARSSGGALPSAASSCARAGPSPASAPRRRAG